MKTLKLTVCGAAGRMGAALIRAIDENSETELVCALERSGSDKIGYDSGTLSGIGENNISVSDDLDNAIEISDGLIDFTAPAASIALAQKLSGTDCFQVIGTTGFTQNEDAELSKAAETATILKSGNMSLGVNLLAALVEKAAASLAAEDFDIEVLEMHHKHKVDAPSGTALLLGNAAAKGRGIDLQDNSVRTRDGITGAREKGTIGFATLRGGAVIGDHSVMFAGESERIELSHFAQDRSLFARGAVKAATWVNDKPHGLYSMRDVLGL
ncbi:MAG: 4-hydroxy-tetrahydrodipicolinate reductase [Rhizobiaceae bacterium]|nr:4-hydroxy-tetrahydrodipicolinate reductase [Rhizobiaceae bacterium]